MARKKLPAPDEGFLRDICEHPQKDGPRLVYADWLEENGQPRRAEFIRLQCRLAQMEEDDPQREDLSDREWELLAVYRERWLPAWPAWARKPKFVWGLTHGPDFRRGFVARLSATLAAFLRDTGKLFAATPLEEIHFRSVSGRLREALGSPLLARLARLSLSGNSLTAEDVQALFGCPHLAGLRRLRLTDLGGQAKEALTRLAAWPGLARLTHLELYGPGIGYDDLDCLLASPYLSALTHLALGATSLEAVGVTSRLSRCGRLGTLTYLRCNSRRSEIESSVRFLAEAPSLGTLRHLAMPLSGPDLEFLATSPFLAQLSSLRSPWTNPPVDALKALAGSPHLSGLRTLDLASSRLDAAKAAALLQGRFASLRALDLSSNRIGPAGARALAGSPALTNLTSLNLCACYIGAAGAAALAGSPLQPTRLELSFNDLGPEGVAALARSPILSRVRDLVLINSHVDDEGIQVLAASPHAANLWRLNLWNNGLSDAAARALAASPHLSQLRSLILVGNNGVTEAGLRALASSPNLPRLLVLQTGSRDESTVSPLLKEHAKGLEL